MGVLTKEETIRVFNEYKSFNLCEWLGTESFVYGKVDISGRKEKVQGLLY